jgi:hypothetical protein
MSLEVVRELRGFATSIQENFKVDLECLIALVCALKPLHHQNRKEKENGGSQYISFKHYE